MARQAYPGARAAEHGAIGEVNERSQVVLRAPKLESDLCLPGGRRRRKRRSPNTSASAGQRVFRNPSRAPSLVPGVPSVRLHRALGMRSTPSARQIRAQAASDAPRASFDSATVEPKQAGHTHACHKACVKSIAKPGFVRSFFSADDSSSFRFPRNLCVHELP